MAILDPSWLLLGPIWSQNGPGNDPKKYPKNVQKKVQKTAPKMLNSKMILGSNLTQFSGQIASKTQQSKYARHTQSASDFIKRLKNVTMSSKSGFSPQELPNWYQNTNMKWLKNVKLSSKSGFSHQELSNSSQDTNIKQLKNVKQWSKPAFPTQEIQYNSLKTWIHRSNHLLALTSFQTDQKILT